MDGWNESANAWVEAMGERGDWGREHVLDPAMLERVEGRGYAQALDVGCGEGRFCRMLGARGIETTGIDPTEDLIGIARDRHPQGRYEVAVAENLPFDDASFDLVVSYLTLIDIPDFRSGLKEMTRVLKPGGSLLIANLTGFMTSRPDGWVTDKDGRHLHYLIDDYMEEAANWVDISDVRVQNWHRPLSAYMQTLLALGLTLLFFDEPTPRSGDDDTQARYRRVPWFMMMEWRRERP